MRWPAGPGARSRWALLALGAALPAAEAAVLSATGPAPAVALAPEVGAPTPFGAFHDLRWLAVYHNSWWTFGAELTLLVGFRAVVDALFVRLSWPAGGPEIPRFTRILAATSALTVFLVVALAPWTAVLFGLAVTPVSWLFLVGLPPVLAVAALTAHASGDRGWWTRLPPATAVGWLAASFGALTAAGGLLSVAPRWTWIPLAGGAGLANARCWRGVVGGAVVRRRARHPLPFAPLACLGLTGLALGGAALGFGAQAAPVASPTTTAGPDRGGRPDVLVVAGLGTSWNGVTAAPSIGGRSTRWFSYRGLSRAGAPDPYVASDTFSSLAVLDRRMAAQVAALRSGSGRPVGIVAVSEGALVAQTYLWSLPPGERTDIGPVVLVNPVVDPGRVYYPEGSRQGWGVASGWALGVFTDGLRFVSSINVAPDTPLFRSIVDGGPGLRGALREAPPEIRETVLLPLADAVSSPPPVTFPGPDVVSLGFHNGGLSDPVTRGLAAEVLNGRRPRSSILGPLASVVRAAAAPWQVPDLQPGLVPAWRR